MCWISYNEKFQVMKIAKTDIQVYKILKKYQSWIFKRTQYVSLYHRFKYKLDKVYKSKLGVKFLEEYNGLQIEEGLYSFINFEEAYFYRANVSSGSLPWIICKAVIPKGSVYYINEDGEVVSDKLKVTEYAVSQ